MSKHNLKPGQLQELGGSIADIMADYASLQLTELPGFLIVADGSLSFYLGDSAENLVGHWTITVKRTSLD